MTSEAGKAFHIWLSLLAWSFLALTAAAQDQPHHARAAAQLEATKGSFVKSETITGALATVDPAKGLIIIARHGPHDPPTLQLSWSEKVSSTGEHGEMGPITVSEGPGETDFDFRVTNSTLIHVNGVRKPLTSLAALLNANVKVRFTPRREGDFALEVSVIN